MMKLLIHCSNLLQYENFICHDIAGLKNVQQIIIHEDYKLQRSSEAWILDVNSTHIIRSNDVQAVLWTSCASSVTSQNDEFRNGCFKKTKYANFSEKRTFLNFWCAHTRVRIRGGDKKLSFFGKIGLLSFLEHSFGDSPFFPYYQRYVQFTSCVQGVDLRLVCLGCDVKGNNGTKWVYWNDIFKWMAFSGFNY